MRILVTGGAGYLGSELCAQSLVRGWDVIATQHRTPATLGRAVTLDVRDEAAVQRAFLRYGPDVVVHTAYLLSGAEMVDTNVRGSRCVAEAAARLGARLVQLSTDLVFDGEAGAPYTEEDEPRPVMDYGAAKAEAERLVASAHPAALVVRTSLLYGKPEPGPQERLASRRDVSFYSDEIRCPVRVDELARAILDLAQTDVAGPLHVAGPVAIARDEFARILRERHGLDPDVATAPTPPGRPRDVALDSSKAARLLDFSLSGPEAR
jgi:dTDP-4-dehydrorhamnose reductase